MSIRTYDGKWLISGYGIATSGDCCCGDSPPPGDCVDCGCHCLVLNGRNLCEPGSDPSGTSAFNAIATTGGTRWLWYLVSPAGYYFWSQETYSNCSGGSCADSEVYNILLYPLTCVNGVEWGPAGLYAADSLAFTSSDPVGSATNHRYSTVAVTRDSSGCPASASFGGKTVTCEPAGCSSVDPLVPALTFADCPPMQMFALSVGGGAGTELKSLLGSFGIRSTGKCGCDAMAQRMNSWGPAKSLENIEQIVDVMQKTAKSRRLPFLRAAAKKLVQIACRRAARKQPPPDNSR